MTDNETPNVAPDGQQPEPPRKRRWGKRIVVGVMLAGLSLTTVAVIGVKSVSAKFWRDFGDGKINVERMSERLDWRIDRALSRVNGTTEQKQKISAIAKAALEDMAKMEIAPRLIRSKFVDLLQADTVDPAAIESFRAEQVAKIDAASKRVVQAVTEAAAILNVEQRRELVRGPMHGCLPPPPHDGWGSQRDGRPPHKGWGSQRDERPRQGRHHRPDW